MTSTNRRGGLRTLLAWPLALILALLAMTAIPAAANHTVLHTTATNTAVGAWSQLPTGSTPGWNNGQIIGPNGGGGCTVFQYQGKAVWNPVGNSYQVAAAAHGDGGACGPSNKTVVYTDATSTWSEGPQLQGGSDPQHMYDQNGMMPNGTHIASGYNSEVIKLWTNGGSSWTSLATVPTDSSIPVGEANVYFPDYPGGAKIIHLSPAWGVWIVDPTTGATSCIGRTSAGGAGCSGKPQLAGSWGDHNVSATYSPICNCVMLGSTGAWVRLDSSGNFTTMSQTGGPAGYGSGDSVDGPGGQFPVDPVSGKILMLSVQSPGDGAMRQFDPTAGATGTWTTVMANSGLPAIFRTGNGSNGAACTGVPLYGVVMCVKSPDGQNWAGAQAWIYKHTASGPVNPTLTVAKAGAGSGTVTGTGINCGVDCSEQVTAGTSITLTASAAGGSTFTGWSGGGCSGTGSCAVVVNADVTVTATFTAPNSTLTITKAGVGSGTVTSAPAGIDCGTTCSFAFANGTSVTLTATPAAGSTFTGWSGGTCSGTAPCVVVVSSATAVTATFFAPTLTVSKSGLGSGTVSSAPSGIACGTTCSAVFNNGASVTLTAAPSIGSTFTGWSGACSGSSATCVFTISANTTVTAAFATSGGGTDPDTDFANRCNAAIATGGRCFHFDDVSQVPTANGVDCWGCNFGAFSKFGASSYTGPTIDSTIKTSGAGALKFTFPAGGGSDGGGSWFTNFSNPVGNFQVGIGDEVWIQFRYRPSSGAISKSNNPDLDINHSATGYKISHVGTGDTAACNTGTGKNTTNCPGSCSDMEIVVDPTWKDGGANPPAPLLAYANCNASVGQPILNVTRDGGSTFDIHPNWTGTPTRSCMSNGSHQEPNCFVFHADEWHTVKYHVRVTGWNTWNANLIEIYAAHDGQPTQLLIKCGPGVNCSDNSNATVQGFFLNNTNTAIYKMGKVWLDPYITNQGGPLQAYNAWFDELIISRQDIADPGAAPPSNPVLTVSKTGSGSGTVTSAPAGISCGATCAASFASGSSPVLTATPSGGATFTGWSGGGCAGTGTCTVNNITANTTVTATFTQPTFALTVTKAGAGAGTVTSSPAGISCGATCSASFLSGQSVTLTAAPTSGTFGGWSGAGCSGTGACVVSMTQAQAVTATFNSGGALQFGLEWPGTGDVRRMLYWNSPPPAYPMTYVFQAFPRRKATSAGCLPNMKTGYYTMFFWGNNGPFAWNGGQSGRFYGMHPYPGVPFNPPCAAGTWEESLISGDWFFPPFPNQTEVSWDRWHTQVIRVQQTGTNSWHYEFYFDWPDQTKLISQDVVGIPDGGNPPVPAIVVGQAPDICGAPPCESGNSWGGYPGWEEYNGVLRGFQFYTTYLSLTDIAAEVATPQSSTAGNANVWYLNLNPRPSDVTDKKTVGSPHNPAWAGTTAIEWTSGTISPPAAPSNLRIGP